MIPPRRWNIFCVVVDNYGDAGVAWRLARELAVEHGLAVRLFCDRMPTLALIAPDVDPGRDIQNVRGVELRRWDGPAGNDVPGLDGGVIVEMFGCGLPEILLLALTQNAAQPAWINVEYLSAESWVESTHGLASRHPRLPLVRHFFFPGFTSRTGGLLRERDLISTRDAFQQSDGARAALWGSLRLDAPGAGALTVSLFCYPNRSLSVLLGIWTDGLQPIFCVVPEGVASHALEAWRREATMQERRVFTRGRLTVATIPFVAQDDYDRLLWACDFNFVRGEDSFVRAQWAARPLVWHAYPQEEDAHRLKLDAFVARYGQALPPPAANAYDAFSRAWNDASPMRASLWRDLIQASPVLGRHAQAWAKELAKLPEFANSLVKFVSDRV